MNDSQIIELFFDRNEEAIRRLEEKYGSYLQFFPALWEKSPGDWRLTV